MEWELSLERRLHVSSCVTRSPVWCCRRRRWCPTCRLDSGVLDAELLCLLGCAFLYDLFAWQVVLIQKYGHTEDTGRTPYGECVRVQGTTPFEQGRTLQQFCLDLHLPITYEINAPTTSCSIGPCLPHPNRAFGRSSGYLWICMVHAVLQSWSSCGPGAIVTSLYLPSVRYYFRRFRSLWL